MIQRSWVRSQWSVEMGPGRRKTACAGPGGRRARRRRARRGITIIETMVVMSGVATILGLCAVTIQVLLRVNADNQARLGASSALDRLASQFRADVHASSEARIEVRAPTQSQRSTAATTLRLTLGPQIMVAYAAVGERVARDETGPGGSRRHESYDLGRGADVRFEPRDEGPHRFLAMIVTRRAGQEPIDPDRTLEVLALGRKHRPEPLKAEGSQAR